MRTTRRLTFFALAAILGAGIAFGQSPSPLPAPSAPSSSPSQGTLPVAPPPSAAPILGFPAADGLAPPPAIPYVPGVELAPDWPRWFTGASGLVMTRTLPGGAPVALSPGHGVVLATSDAAASWSGGIDLHLGRWLWASQEHGVEAVYWGAYGIGSTATVTDPANRLQAAPRAPGMTVAGSPASSFLTNARAESISRSDLVNNVEINWLWAPWGRPEFFVPGEGPVTLTWLAGFRFFELEDVLQSTSLSGSVPPGATIGWNGGANQFGLGVATNNDIFGAQIGGKADWHLLPKLRLSVVKKFMFGGNAITDTSTMATGNGVVGTFPGGAPAQAHGTASAFSYLGQLDGSLVWDVSRTWSLSLGYRLVGLANIAQADPSWPQSVTSSASLLHLNTNGSTFVHGAFAGFQGRF